MNPSKDFTFSRRQFVQAAAATTVLICSPFGAFAKGIKASTRDGILHMDQNGKIHIHSGTGHIGPYGDQKAISVVSDVLNCPSDHCRVNMGQNPDHLFTLLGQYSNHLSFSSAVTNKAAVTVLKETLIAEAKKHFGRNDYVLSDYDLKDGIICGANHHVAVCDLVRSMNKVIVESGVSQKSRDYIKNMDKGGIIIAVQEVT